jgi:hypothetical protein
MLLVRKIDLWAQLIIIFATLVLCLAKGIFVVLYGALLIGAWQLLSALCNTYSFSKSIFKVRIIKYWFFSFAVIVFFFLTAQSLLPNLAKYYWGFGFTAAWLTAIYYWFIYYRFIQSLRIREALSTVVRS